MLRWTRLDGVIHLVRELVDGSHGCLPASWTDVFGDIGDDRTVTPAFTTEALRQFPRLLELLGARR